MIPGNRLYFTVGFLVFAACYFLSDLLPSFRASILLGALLVSAFAFFFITRMTLVVLKNQTPDSILLFLAVFSIAGVIVLNMSLYNFSNLPATEKNVRVVEDSKVLKIQQMDEKDPAIGKNLFVAEKNLWLIKMFMINLCLGTMAVSIGCLLGKRVQKPSHIFAILFLGGIMDIWSVSSGVTKKIVTSKLNCYYFLFNWPVAGGGNVTAPLIGSTDFIFIALFLYLFRKFDLPVRKNIIGLSVAVVISLFSAGITGIGIPALPFIGISVLVLNFKAILPDRKEMMQILVGSIIIFSVFSVLWKFK